MHTVKWFQVLLCITNNLIKYKSFVYEQLNDQTVLFLSIKFSIIHLFAFSLNVKLFYLLQIGPGSHGNEGVLVIFKGLLKSHHHIRWFTVISRTLVGWSSSPVEMQLVYSTALADWAVCFCEFPSLSSD